MARADGPIRVVVVDDHRSYAESLRVALGVERGIEVAGVCHDGETAVEVVRRKRPDVVLMDAVMPGMDGITATRSLREADPDARVLILSAHEDEETLANAVEAGAAGFLSKAVSVKEIARVVRTAARGEALLAEGEVRRLGAAAKRRRQQEASLADRVRRLTPRETEILQRLANGSPAGGIAEDMGISANTVRTHVQNILFKLKVHSKVEALAAAIRFGKVRAGPGA